MIIIVIIMIIKTILMVMMMIITMINMITIITINIAILLTLSLPSPVHYYALIYKKPWQYTIASVFCLTINMAIITLITSLLIKLFQRSLRDIPSLSGIDETAYKTWSLNYSNQYCSTASNERIIIPVEKNRSFKIKSKRKMLYLPRQT